MNKIQPSHLWHFFVRLFSRTQTSSGSALGINKCEGGCSSVVNFLVLLAFRINPTCGRARIKLCSKATCCRQVRNTVWRSICWMKSKACSGLARTGVQRLQKKLYANPGILTRDKFSRPATVCRLPFARPLGLLQMLARQHVWSGSACRSLRTALRLVMLTLL